MSPNSHGFALAAIERRRQLAIREYARYVIGVSLVRRALLRLRDGGGAIRSRH